MQKDNKMSLSFRNVLKMQLLKMQKGNDFFQVEFEFYIDGNLRHKVHR